jgi:hypothetical protein
MKHVKVVYYGLICDIPPEGVEATGELMVLPFSSGEPPYYRKEADGTITFLDWVAILETCSDDEDDDAK